MRALSLPRSSSSTAGDDWSHNCLTTKTNINKYSFCYDTYVSVRYITYLYLMTDLLALQRAHSHGLNIIAHDNSQILSSWRFIYLRHANYHQKKKKKKATSFSFNLYTAQEKKNYVSFQRISRLGRRGDISE